MISKNTIVVLADEQSSVSLEGQTVVLNLPSGNYYQLDEVGARVWDLLREPTTAADVCRRLSVEYEVDADTVENDVMEFLHELASEGLIRAAGGPERSSAGAGAGA